MTCRKYKKRVFRDQFIILWGSFFAILFPTISLADAERIFKENNKAVVVVAAYDFANKPMTLGSGFIVREDGLITSYHVVKRAINIKVKSAKQSGWREIEGFTYIDEDDDLIILKIKEPPPPPPGKVNLVCPLCPPYPMVKLGDKDNVNIGEKIYVISSPQGLENTITEGILSGLRDADWGGMPILSPLSSSSHDLQKSVTKRLYRKKILQITAPISFGSSGGPVFNKNGEVIGIVRSLVKEGQNLNFAVPINLIKDEIENKEIIPLEKFLEKSENEYIKWLATAMLIPDDWNELYIKIIKGPKGKDVEVFKKILQINPKHAAANYFLCIIYYSEGNREKALEH